MRLYILLRTLDGRIITSFGGFFSLQNTSIAVLYSRAKPRGYSTQQSYLVSPCIHFFHVL